MDLTFSPSYISLVCSGGLFIHNSVILLFDCRMWSGRLGVELFDTSQGTEDINIGTTLIEMGQAAAVSDHSSKERGRHSEADSAESAQDGDVTYVPG